MKLHSVHVWKNMKSFYFFRIATRLSLSPDNYSSLPSLNINPNEQFQWIHNPFGNKNHIWSHTCKKNDYLNYQKPKCREYQFWSARKLETVKNLFLSLIKDYTILRPPSLEFLFICSVSAESLILIYICCVNCWSSVFYFNTFISL